MEVFVEESSAGTRAQHGSEPLEHRSSPSGVPTALAGSGHQSVTAGLTQRQHLLYQDTKSRGPVAMATPPLKHCC